MSQYLSITALCGLLPPGSKPEVVWRARQGGAIPDPDVQLSIVITGRAKAVPGWDRERMRPWLDLVEETTRGYPLRYSHLKFLKTDRESWWDTDTAQLATAADIRAVCPGLTKESIRWCLRSPAGWWHSEAVTVGNRTGWPLPIARRIITDLGWKLDHSRWEWLVELANPNLSPGGRSGLLFALTAAAE